MKFKVYSGRDLFKFFNQQPLEPILNEKDFLVFTISDNKYFVLDKEYLEVIDQAHVWVVLKNQDFNEGGGPMLIHKVYGEFKDAVEYIMSQGGIYGSTQGVSNWLGVSAKGSPYCSSHFNGYDLVPYKIS